MLLSLRIFERLTGNSYESLLDWYSHGFPRAFDRYTVAAQSFTPAWHEWMAAHRQEGLILLYAMPILYLAFSRSIWRFFQCLVSELWNGLVFWPVG
jgi:hypothetical protein